MLLQNIRSQKLHSGVTYTSSSLTSATIPLLCPQIWHQIVPHAEVWQTLAPQVSTAHDSSLSHGLLPFNESVV